MLHPFNKIHILESRIEIKAASRTSVQVCTSGVLASNVECREVLRDARCSGHVKHFIRGLRNAVKVIAARCRADGVPRPTATFC